MFVYFYGSKPGPSGVGPFYTPTGGGGEGHHLNKCGKGLLGNASYQI